MADYVGIGSALALTSGTAAIHLALRYLGVKRGDTVFCSSLTFIGSTNPILYQGAEPVFIDSEPASWNMSPAALERALSDARKKNTLPKAVIIVNLYGQSADFDPLLELCEAYNIPVIEDAAESLGATYNGKASGSLGAFGIFSFNGSPVRTFKSLADRHHARSRPMPRDALPINGSTGSRKYRSPSGLEAFAFATVI